MKIAVIGATGMVGSALTSELLGRGHHVTGIARNTSKLAEHSRLSPRVADVMKMPELAEAIRDHDAVVVAYAPGAAMGPQVYKTMIEAMWKIKRVFAEVGGKYLVNIGGASSLWSPRGTQMFEDPLWPAWYFNTASPEHLRYLHGMTGKDIFEKLALSRERILATPGLDPQSDWPEEEFRQFIQKVAENHDKGEAGRAQLEFFRNDVTIRWSFVSPPWFMRPDPRTGKYRIVVDKLPMNGDIPAGIAVADLAVAIADEVEAHKLVHKHWSAARVAE